MDLATGAGRIVVLMFHLTRDGEPKLVPACTYPLTAERCVRTIVTDLAVVDVDADGFVLRELAPGVGSTRCERGTAAPSRVAPTCCEMELLT
jgi:3-oxoacid CoA-transferase B subunit